MLLFVWGAHTAGSQLDRLDDDRRRAAWRPRVPRSCRRCSSSGASRERVPRGKSSVAVSTWLTVSLPLLAVGACEVVLQNADVMLLNFFRPSAEVGIYYAATQDGGPRALRALRGRQRLCGPHRVGHGARRRDRNAPAGARIRALDVLSVAGRDAHASSPSDCRCCRSSATDFTEAYPLMFILAAGVLARAATGPSELILNMLGHQRACATSLATAAVVSVIAQRRARSRSGALRERASLPRRRSTTAAFLNWRAAKRLSGVNLFVLAAGNRASPARVAPAVQSTR